MFKMEKRYNYFYKITNLINQHFYYGIHSTNNLEDGYMGSGHRLHNAYKKYGIKNFQKEILKYFNTRQEALNYELEIVNEKLVNDLNCYNLILGGKNLNITGTVCVKDRNGNTFLVSQNDERYLSGELKHTNCFRTLSDETKRKLSEKAKLRKGIKYNKSNKSKKHKLKKKVENTSVWKGERNSQYNTTYVYKDSIEKRIKKNLLD